MWSAWCWRLLTSALFLVSYLVYHYHAGSVSFRSGGSLRLVYFTILLSHTVLATFGVVPLVVLTLTRALRRDFARHSRIAQVTFPIWLYVSVTGVVIYLMLYHLPVIASSAQPDRRSDRQLVNIIHELAWTDSRPRLRSPTGNLRHFEHAWLHRTLETIQSLNHYLLDSAEGQLGRIISIETSCDP